MCNMSSGRDEAMTYIATQRNNEPTMCRYSINNNIPIFRFFTPAVNNQKFFSPSQKNDIRTIE